MSSPASQPGKTAPKFLSDLLAFDPLHALSGQNILVDPAPIFDDDPLLPKLATGSCKHEYITKPTQTLSPRLDERPDRETVWKLSAVCKRCRLHMSLTAHYLDVWSPCPNQKFPLHHFRDTPIPLNTGQDVTIQHNFTCSAPDCQAGLIVAYNPPVLSSSDIVLLTDEAALQRRYQQIIEAEPAREGLRLATPQEALWRLKRYLDDTLDPTQHRSSFPAYNKRFQEAFGSDCDALLNRFGFEFAPDEDNGPTKAKWLLPVVPKPSQDPTYPLDPDRSRTLLENCSIELQILMEQLCATTATPSPVTKGTFASAHPGLERLVAAQGYEKSGDRKLRSAEEDHPYYASLGALSDFSDKLIAFAYERQTTCDPENTPYYFDCLQDIAHSRQSDSLSVKASTLASQDVIGRKEIIQAYRDLGIPPALGETYSESRIIGLFRSRLSDSGPEAQVDLKQALKRIGHARHNQAMLDAASDTVETYDQALAYLNAERNFSDDSVTALYTAKILDSPESTDMARQSVQIIADERNSDSLRSWLSTGELNSPELDIAEACAHLNVQLDMLDPDTLEIVVANARADNPGKKTESAIVAVQKAFYGQQEAAGHSANSWPVGLVSHGNTCYLNSLLQYYFTVKPLRDLVLDFDQYKFDLASHGAKSERVGNLHVTALEIEQYQKFADDLRQLFEHMIKDQGPAVRPEAELVCRAFLKASDPSLVASLVHELPDTKHEDVEMSVAETQKAEEVREIQEPAAAADVSMSNSTAESISSQTLSNHSEETLLGSEAPEPPTQTVDPSMLPPSPPMSINGDKPEPQHAPPLPPRKPATTPDLAQTNLQKAEEAAKRQQDVAEVMEDILYRLRVAIKPTGEDAHKEQLDQFRDIFNMRYVETTLVDNGTPTTTEEDVTNLLLDVPYEPTDIYSALDRVLDIHSDRIGEKPVQQYRSFQTLPPLLQISIPRIDQDRKTGKVFKATHKLYLEDVLYMDRYMDEPEILERRKRCWALKKLLQALGMEKDMLAKTSIGIDGPTALDTAGRYLSSLVNTAKDLQSIGMESIAVPDGLEHELHEEAVKQRCRIDEIDQNILELQKQISTEFEGLTKVQYRLHAVFFHRGSSGHGHYWTYIHDFRNDMWRKYNDETVEQFTKLSEIFAADDWQHGTPTYAVYVRDDVKDAYVEPVCRHVEEPVTAIPEEPKDVEMSGSSHVDMKVQDDTQDDRKTEWASAESSPTSDARSPLSPMSFMENQLRSSIDVVSRQIDAHPDNPLLKRAQRVERREKAREKSQAPQKGQPLRAMSPSKRPIDEMFEGSGADDAGQSATTFNIPFRSPQSVGKDGNVRESRTAKEGSERMTKKPKVRSIRFKLPPKPKAWVTEYQEALHKAGLLCDDMWEAEQ